MSEKEIPSPQTHLRGPKSEWPHLIQLGRTLGFFASVIKSGEPWTATCQSEYDLANVAMKEAYADLNSRVAEPPQLNLVGPDEYQQQEKICTQAAMSQWETSLKRLDLEEKDRVYGAIAAYKRQAFVFNVCQFGDRSPHSSVVGGRPTEKVARGAVEAFLNAKAPGYPDYSLHEDGNDGWSFYIAEQDTTSYLHRDLSVEWYGTGWPDHYEYDDSTGNWISTPAVELRERG